MSFQCDSSIKDLTPAPDFWENYRPKSENGRSMLYRYEYEGIVVYDCYARLSNEPAEVFIPTPPKEIPLQTRKEIENATEYDRLQYLEMKNYLPRKVYAQEYTLVIPHEKTLKFNSKFECGNLHKAIKVNENEYNLLLEYDAETKGYTQWYYFAVQTYKPNHTVRLNLVNLMKYESLYNNGMKPLVYSTCKNKDTGLAWHRDGCSISYFRNSTARKYTLDDSKASKYYYTLTFSYTFAHNSDTVYFAHCFPYSFTNLCEYLDTLTKNPSNKTILRVDPLCKTLAGNICPVLTITNSVDTYTSWESEYYKLQKSAAARKIIKMREFREEAKLRIFEYVKNVKIVEGKI